MIFEKKALLKKPIGKRERGMNLPFGGRNVRVRADFGDILAVLSDDIDGWVAGTHLIW